MRLALLLILLHLAPAFLPRAAGSTDILPPFGLEWGESTTRMEQMLKNAKARIVERRTINRRAVWVVEGLQQANLRRTLFHFRNSGLEEVELQYENSGWSQAQYNQFLSELRTRIERRYGTGKLSAQKRETVADGVLQTVVGYHWNRGPSQIEIIYYAAEKSPDIYRTVSLHYKAMPTAEPPEEMP